MLFALFLGAGNIIFPPLLGQMAGDELIAAMTGFLIAGVGLPLVAVLAIANAGGGLQSIAGRVSPWFGVIFTMIVYMAIGPLFGILLVFTIIFFALTVALALNPAKLVDRVGKVLTPVLFIVIGALAIKSILTPMGEIGQAQGDYQGNAFFRSFIEGYLTMDVIAALVFGIVVINALKAEGVTESRAVMKAMIVAGVIAAVGLALVYIALSYVGATSPEAIGLQENGGAILALVSTALFGSSGTAILAATIILACITTAIGLVSACAQYFELAFPRYTYQTYVFLFAGFSTVISNVGLTQLISISVPILLMIYPLAIVLMLLSFIDKSFDRQPIVYILALLATAFVSIFDGLRGAGIDVVPVTKLLAHLPLHEQQIGWLVPAIVGTLIGVIVSPLLKKQG